MEPDGGGVVCEAGCSSRVARVASQFGLPRHVFGGGVADPIRVRLGAGRITALVGPSGSGKTTALRQLEAKFPQAHNVDRLRFPRDCPVVDAVLPEKPLADALAILSGCALGEPRLWVRSYDELSEGEKFRARLARALGLQAGSRVPAPLLCDEFCAGLHRRAARAIAYNLRKLVTRLGLNLVVATSNDDVLPDLQPDTLIRLAGDGRREVLERSPVRRPLSLARRLHIAAGSKRDYAAFAAMHYRGSDGLGFVDKVFVMRLGIGGEPMGIVVYAHAPLELALRNKATRGRFSGNPARLNRELRIVRRLVIHPDLRGCGLGHRLVRETLPAVGTSYVETLASMGAVNPVFEKAGMQRIGQCALPREQQSALEDLRGLGVDPLGRDFLAQISRRPRVRRLARRMAYNWYRATTGCGQRRARRQTPQALAQTVRGLVGSQPVYYLWHRPGGCTDQGDNVRHQCTAATRLDRNDTRTSVRADATDRNDTRTSVSADTTRPKRAANFSSRGRPNVDDTGHTRRSKTPEAPRKYTRVSKMGGPSWRRNTTRP